MLHTRRIADAIVEHRKDVADVVVADEVRPLVKTDLLDGRHVVVAKIKYGVVVRWCEVTPDRDRPSQPIGIDAQAAAAARELDRLTG